MLRSEACVPVDLQWGEDCAMVSIASETVRIAPVLHRHSKPSILEIGETCTILVNLLLAADPQDRNDTCRALDFIVVTTGCDTRWYENTN